MANEWDRSAALKRGGGIPAISLDGARERYEIGPSGPASPESEFDREWAVSLVSKALHDLEDEMRGAGSEGRFTVLKGYLTGDSPVKSYRDVAADLGLSESAVKVAVHRMRRRLGTLLRNEIAQTVADVAMARELPSTVETMGETGRSGEVKLAGTLILVSTLYQRFVAAEGLK